MTLIVPMLLYASETWTSTMEDLNHLQAFHMRCQRRILDVRWFHNIKNSDITHRTGLPHIGDLIQKRRHVLFSHVARMDPQATAHVALKLYRDGPQSTTRLEKVPGLLAHYLVRSVKEGQGETSIDTLDPGSGPIVVKEGSDGLAELRDLVE